MSKHMDRYRSDPEYRAMIIERQRIARLKRRSSDPERFALLEREKERRKREKITVDPEKYAKYLRARRLRHVRQMADPAERERLNAKRRKGPLRQTKVKRSVEYFDPIAALRRALHENELWASVQAVIPANYAADYRDDLTSEAVTALLAGEAPTPEDAVKLGRQRLNRATSSYGLVSLDQPMMNGGSWHDCLAA